MKTRYFNLKIGSQNTNGWVIRVDPSESDINRKLRDFFGEDDYQFNHVEAGIYDMSIPDKTYVNFTTPTNEFGGNINVPVPVEHGLLALLRIEVMNDSMLRIVKELQGQKV